jgi:hypothetical protein
MGSCELANLRGLTKSLIFQTLFISKKEGFYKKATTKYELGLLLNTSSFYKVLNIK